VRALYPFDQSGGQIFIYKKLNGTKKSKN